MKILGLNAGEVLPPESSAFDILCKTKCRTNSRAQIQRISLSHSYSRRMSYELTYVMTYFIAAGVFGKKTFIF